MQQQTLHLRLLRGGEAINPDARDLAPPTAEDVEESRNDTSYVDACIRNASAAECAAYAQEHAADKTYDEQMTEWKKDLVQKAKDRCLPTTQEGQNAIRALNKIGIVAENFTEETAQNIYDQFCFAEDGTSQMDQLVHKIVENNTLEELQENIEAYRWLAHVGGAENPDVVFHTALARKRAEQEADRQQLVDNAGQATEQEGAQVSNYNTIDPTTDRVLRHLYAHRPADAEAQPQEQGPPPVEPEPEQEGEEPPEKAETENSSRFASYAATERGGRPNKTDEDAVYTLETGIVGELDKKDLATALGIQESDIDDVHNRMQELVKQGKLGNVAILADGMGGHAAGEYASNIAVFAVQRAITEAVEKGDPISDTLITQAVKDANKAIVDFADYTNKVKAETDPEIDPGTTITVSVVGPDGKGYVVSVGDSRIYKRKADGTVDLITDADNVAEVLQRLGMSTSTQVLSDPNKNGVTNALGKTFNESIVEVQEVSLTQGDMLLHMCDGVWESITVEEVRDLCDKKYNALPEDQRTGMTLEQYKTKKEVWGEIIAELYLRDVPAGATADQVGEALMQWARDNQGDNTVRDNISAAVLQYKGQQSP
jgi:protein phosphatase